MQHITAQLLSTESVHTIHGPAARRIKSAEIGQKEKGSPDIQLNPRFHSAKCQLTTPGDSPVSARTPKTQNISIPTPTSATSANLVSPQKPPQPSSVAITNPLDVMQGTNTPIAELEDTSIVSTYPELEDTSRHALVSQGLISISLRSLKSRHHTTRSLFGALDEQFADYEAEIRSLRNSLAEAHKSLCQAKKVVNDLNHAIEAAQDAIADRNYEIEVKNHLIAELEKEVCHCLQHHLGPPPPSKFRVSDGAVSRFNLTANHSPKSLAATNSPPTVSPSLIGRQFVVTPKQSTEGSSTAPSPKTPGSVYAAASPVILSASAGGSPMIGPPHRSQAPPLVIPKQLTLEALSTALASAASAPIVLADAPEDSHVKITRVKIRETPKQKSTSSSAEQYSHRTGNLGLHSSASSPNLCNNQSSLLSRLPPLPSIMSGGLRISEGPYSEPQGQSVRKKYGGLGDLFRRKDQG